MVLQIPGALLRNVSSTENFKIYGFVKVKNECSYTYFISCLDINYLLICYNNWTNQDNT